MTRVFDEQGADWFLAAHRHGLLADLVDGGHLVQYEILSSSPLVVESPRLPFVTYPYEWSASMLRDAGLATLDLARVAWDAGFHLRDASAFNLVFHAGRPVMVDLGSFRPGHTPYFFAYGQFCDHFLNPLALFEITGVTHRLAWSSLEGLDPTTTRRLVGWRIFKPGYLRHVWARARLEERAGGIGAAERRSVREDYGLPPAAVRRSFDSLASLLSSIAVDVEGSWEDYEVSNSYGAEEASAKAAFVSRAAERHAGRRAVDIGANTGAYSALLSPHFDTVVAVEGDEAAVDILYQRIRSGLAPANVVPMVMDFVDPSPGRGFQGEALEAGLARLAGSDLIVWLAVVHHLVLSRNVPLPLLVDVAASLAPGHVMEHVAPEDPMSELLLASRDETPWPLDRESFEAAVGRRFRVVDTLDVTETRRLYELAAL